MVATLYPLITNNNITYKEYFMAGYDWSRGMSNNAVYAYSTGEKPKSKWTKAGIIGAVRGGYDDDLADYFNQFPLTFLREHLLTVSSWHHTSKFYNATDFYSLDDDYLEDVSLMTDAERDELLSSAKQKKKRGKTWEEYNAGKVEKYLTDEEKRIKKEVTAYYRPIALSAYKRNRGRIWREMYVEIKEKQLAFRIAFYNTMRDVADEYEGAL